MAWLNRSLIALNFGATAFLLYWLFMRATDPPALGAGWEYKDFISALLTAITVVLAALAIFLAIAAVWGYQKLADHAAERASSAALKCSEDYLNSDAFFARVTAIAAAHVSENLKAALDARKGVQVAAPAGGQSPPDGETAWRDDA